MAENMNEVIKQIAVAAIEESKPSMVLYGEVINVNPLEIMIDQRLRLTKDYLVLTNAVRDHDIYMSVDHATESVTLSANHNHEAESSFKGDILTTVKNKVEPDSTKVESTAESTWDGTVETKVKNTEISLNHSHSYSGKKRFRVHNGLKQGEKVILIRFKGGQRFLVLDRVVV